MKTIITILFIGLGIFSSYGQELKLSIIENSDEPNTATEHFYLVKVSNPNSETSVFSLATSNIVCSDEKRVQTNFSHKILNKQKARELNELKLRSGETVELYVKLMRPQKSVLNSWNCTKITAISSNREAISNALTIESFIPDPKDFN